MTSTPCLDCGRPADGPRCPEHTRVQRAKYSSGHRAVRAAWAPLVDAGGVVCSMPGCDELIEPGSAWDLGHVPPPSRPQHAACNRAGRAVPVVEVGR